MKLTKIKVDRLPIPRRFASGKTAQTRHYDDVLRGFGVRVTSGGCKAFFVEKRVGRRLHWITLGHYPVLTVEQARREAQKLLGKIASGIDPLAEKQETRARQITLQEVFEDYLAARKSLKPTTLRDYHQFMNRAFCDWRGRPLSRITKDIVVNRHAELGQRSRARADGAMRLLRALFNFAAASYDDTQGRSLFPENPVRRLSQTRAWYRVRPRRTVIKRHELGPWFQSVMRLHDQRASGKSETVRDYLLLLLFTGLRRQEAATLTWENVDLKERTLTIPDPKNREPLTLPLSDFVHRLLATRKTKATNSYVFAGQGRRGYLIEPRRHMKRVTEMSGVAFTLHDLRRTFITVADSLDISAYAIKRLVNHKMSGDVTAGYIVSDAERLRAPMQRITDYLLSVGAGETRGEVVALDHQRISA